jgi:hypothetical protein
MHDRRPTKQKPEHDQTAPTLFLLDFDFRRAWLGLFIILLLNLWGWGWLALGCCLSLLALQQLLLPSPPSLLLGCPVLLGIPVLVQVLWHRSIIHELCLGKQNRVREALLVWRLPGQLVNCLSSRQEKGRSGAAEIAACQKARDKEDGVSLQGSQFRLVQIGMQVSASKPM